MARLGMDVDEVERISRTLTAQSRELLGLTTRMDRSMTTLPSLWLGADATRFAQQEWPRIRALVVAARTDLDELAGTLLRNVAEQREASADAGGTSIPLDRRRVLPLPSMSPKLPPATLNTCKPSTSTDSVEGIIRNLDGMKRADDGIRIQKVVDAKGTARYVLYIGGTFWAANGNLDLIENIPATRGIPTDTTGRVMEELARTLLGDPKAEVMIVGFSQGGIHAQHIANSGRFNVKAVVTAGSPTIGTVNEYGGAQVLRLADVHDFVPLSDEAYRVVDPLYARDRIAASAINVIGGGFHDGSDTTFRSNVEGGQHSIETYTEAGAMFDALTDSKYDAVKKAISRFGGDVANDTDALVGGGSGGGTRSGSGGGGW